MCVDGHIDVTHKFVFTNVLKDKLVMLDIHKKVIKDNILHVHCVSVTNVHAFTRCPFNNV